MNQHVHDETEHLSESAWSHLEHEEYEQCIALATQAINSNLVSAELYRCRAAALYELERYHEALPDYLEALKLDPTDATSAVNAGCVYDALHQYDEALCQYSYAQQSLDYQSAELDFNIGNVLMRLGRLYEALDSYSMALQRNPAFPDSYLNRANVRAQLGQYQEALADYRQAILYAPEDSNIAWMVAWIFFGDNPLSGEKIQELERIALFDPNHYTSHLCKAVLAYCGANFPLAQQEVDIAQALEPDDFDPPFWRGLLAARQGDFELARQSIGQSLHAGLPPFCLLPLRWLQQVDGCAEFLRYANWLIEHYEV